MNEKQIKSSIIYQDEDYFVINKSPGISVLADRSGAPGILELFRRIYPDIQVCHRLDKETSGILILARNPEAYKHASLQFQNRKVKKVYHALVAGRAEFKEYTENRRIFTVENQSFIHKEGKEATTLMNTLEIFNQYSLIECQPITGRMHQIRVHLSVNGYPIVGDITYGGSPFYLSEIKKKYNLGKYEEEKPLLGRVALHAHSVQFQKMNGETISANSPYPKDMKATLVQLGKWNKS